MKLDKKLRSEIQKLRASPNEKGLLAGSPSFCFVETF